MSPSKAKFGLGMLTTIVIALQNWGGKKKGGTDKNPPPLRPCDVHKFKFTKFMITVVGGANQGKDIVFRFIIEYILA